MATQAKPAHSQTPWKVAPGLHGEAHVCLEDGTVVLQSTTRGGLPASSNALHAAACVNGTDARTVALLEAVKIAYGYLSMEEECSEGTNPGVTEDWEKVRALAAIAGLKLM